MSKPIGPIEKLRFLGKLVGGSGLRQTNTLNFDNVLEMLENSEKYNDNYEDEPAGRTVEDQLAVELQVQQIYEEVLARGSGEFPVLKRKRHTSFVSAFLKTPLLSVFTGLDASHPWLIFWLLNAQVILGQPVTVDQAKQVGETVLSFVDPETGGIGGGEGQMAHLAATYAGVMALALAQEAGMAAKLDRQRIYTWLLQLKQPDGSFVMHDGGETDTRAVYCALCVASILGILDDELAANTREWLAACQTYEGGFGGVPFDEAHGGYTFCAVAALCILDAPQKLKTSIDVDRLLEWTVKRQYSLEGGVSGRTNKLVDGCYSHWVGGLTPLLEAATGERNNVVSRAKLQSYILCCCQDERAGLRDKPGTRPDFYHTNYVLCGLSMCQHYQVYEECGRYRSAFGYRAIRIEDGSVDGGEGVCAVDPVFGLPWGVAHSMASAMASEAN